MDAWQAKQQMSTTAMLLPSKRTQTIQEKGLLIAFFPPRKSICRNFRGYKEEEVWSHLEKWSCGRGRRRNDEVRTNSFIFLGKCEGENGKALVPKELRLGNTVRAANLQDKTPRYDTTTSTSVALCLLRSSWVLRPEDSRCNDRQRQAGKVLARRAHALVGRDTKQTA